MITAKNKLMIFSMFGLLLISSVSATTINYYYHPQCGHCQQIAPFIQKIINDYQNIEWNIIDTSKNPSGVGTPTLIINTNDKRQIALVGSYDIPRYSECELNEQSNLNCETYSANQCMAESWFIRE